MKHTHTHTHTKAAHIHTFQLNVFLSLSLLYSIFQKCIMNCVKCFRCKICDVVATAGILNCAKYFLLYHHPHVHIFSIVVAIPVKRTLTRTFTSSKINQRFWIGDVAAVKCSHKMNIECHLRFRLWGHLIVCSLMECIVNMEGIFSFKAYFCWECVGKVHIVLLHQTLYDSCCFFQWQMSIIWVC